MSGSSPSAEPRPLSPSDERLWASLSHFSNVLGAAAFVPALLIHTILGPRSATVRAESREALNFALTGLFAWIALQVAGAVLHAIADLLPAAIDLPFTILAALMGIAQFAVWVVMIVLGIIAGVRVNQGGTYRYPFALRLIR